MFIWMQIVYGCGNYPLPHDGLHYKLWESGQNAYNAIAHQRHDNGNNITWPECKVNSKYICLSDICNENKEVCVIALSNAMGVSYS